MVKLKWTLRDHGNKGFYGPYDAYYTRESKENASIFYDFCGTIFWKQKCHDMIEEYSKT